MRGFGTKYVAQYLSLYEEYTDQFDTMDQALEYLDESHLWILWERRDGGDIIVGSNLSGRSCE